MFYEITNEKYDANPVASYTWEEIVELVELAGHSQDDLRENSSGVVFIMTETETEEQLAMAIED